MQSPREPQKVNSDLAAALLAEQVGADLLMLLTESPPPPARGPAPATRAALPAPSRPTPPMSSTKWRRATGAGVPRRRPP
jgi:hypothetical protein